MKKYFKPQKAHKVKHEGTPGNSMAKLWLVLKNYNEGSKTHI